MYIPKQNLMDDAAEAVAFMQKYSFATLVTTINHAPFATHLPFVVQQNQYGELMLLSHLAKANPHADYLNSGTSLVIFTEPHAYISPRHYDKPLSVPTWNYIAVHAYGQAEAVTDRNESMLIAEEMIRFYEADYRQQWNSLPDDFKSKMLSGIVSFKIKVTDLQGKKKLSQNKTEQEKNRIIAALQNSADSVEKDTGDYMQAEMYNKGS